MHLIRKLQRVADQATVLCSVVALYFCIAPIVLSIHHDGLYFQNDWLNRVVFSIGSLSPIALLVILPVSSTPILRKVIVLALATTIGIPLTFPGFIGLSDLLKDRPDASYKNIGSRALGRHQISAFRTDGGALSNYGLVIEDATPLPAGMKWVRIAYRAYPEASVKLRTLDDRHILCAFPANSEGVRRPDITLTIN